MPNPAELPFDAALDEDIDDELDLLAAEGSPALAGIDLSPITLELTPDACGHRLDKVIAGMVPQFSRSRLQLWFDAGHVLVDGKPARGKDTAYGDETVVILPQSAPEDEA